MAAGELCVCDLMAVLALPQSTVSRHLAYLRDSGLVNDRRKGVWMYYDIPTGEGLIAALLHSLHTEFQKNQTAEDDRRQLANYLANKNNDTCA